MIIRSDNMQIQKTDQDFMMHKVIDQDTSEEIRFIVSADDSKGVYIVYDRDEEGFIKFDAKMNPMLKFKRGNIKIEKKEEM